MVTRRALTAAALAAIAFLGACGDKKVAPTTPASTPQMQDDGPPAGAVPPIEDSVAVRDSLLVTAEEGASTDPGDDGSFGVLEAWARAYPDLSVVGYAIPPDPQTVPVYVNVVSSKDVPSAENPYIISFAVLGTDGVCSGGVAAGFPSLDRFEPVEISGEEQACEPLTVAAVGGYETFG